MKKFTIFLMLLSTIAYGQGKIGNTIPIGPMPFAISDSSTGIKSETQRLGFKFYARTTSPITDVDVYIEKTGTVTGHTYKIYYETDSAGAPSGSTIGGSQTFTGPAANAWTGLLTLTENTGNLTIGTPYWAIIDVNAGTPDASNYIQLARAFTSSLQSGGTWNEAGLTRHHNGTNWTTTAASFRPIAIVFKHADETYSGYGWRGNPTASGYTDIFSTNKQGLRCKFGAKIKVRGVIAGLDAVGTPGNLTASIYEGDTLKYSSAAIAAVDMADALCTTILFPNPVFLAADTTLYITFEQDGTSDSHDYDIVTLTLGSTSYIETIYTPDWRMVYGSGDDPTAFTVVEDKLPIIQLLILDPATDFDEAGTSYISEPQYIF